MASAVRQKEILAEIGELSRHQLAAMEDANFVGWSSEQRAGFLERGNRIDLLRDELAILAAA